MNGPSIKCRRVIHTICLSVIASLFCTSTQASDPIEIMMHNNDVYGARDIESGDYAKGVRRLLTRLGDTHRANSTRTPVVINLCAGYTMLEDFETAMQYCDAAVASGWSTGLALNNRGALHARKGDYENAILDFQAAIDAWGADRMARRNLNRMEVKVAAMLRETDNMLAQATTDTR